MQSPLSHVLVHDAAAFGVALPAVAPRLAKMPPEPVTARLGKGMLLLAEQALRVVQDLRSGLIERVAERTAPWLLRPTPAATVVSFEPPREGAILLERETQITSRPIDSVVCTFRTTRGLRVGPYRVRDSELSVVPGRPAVLLVEFEATGPTPLSDAFGPEIELFFDGQREFALSLVHGLATSARRVSWQSADWDAPLDASPASIARPGFGRDEALAPDTDGIPHAFAVMTEALVSPDKFRFVALSNPLAARPPTSRATLVVQLAGGGEAGWRSQPVAVRPHSVPAVNLFEGTAEPLMLDFEARPQPIRLAGLKAEDAGVYGVRDVFATDRAALRPVRLPSRRRLGANVTSNDAPATFGVTVGGNDGATYLHFTPREGGRVAPSGFVISARVLAHNGARGARVRAGDLGGRIMTAHGPLSYASVVPASAFIAQPRGVDFQFRTLLEAGVRRDAGGRLQSLRRTLSLSIPSWGLPEEQAFAFQDRLNALQSLDFHVARRDAAAHAVQIGYGLTLTIDESPFLGPGELGLFGAALAEALSRSVPVTTFLELTLIGAKTGTATTYSKGVRA